MRFESHVYKSYPSPVESELSLQEPLARILRKIRIKHSRIQYSISSPVDLYGLGTEHVHKSVRRPEQPGHMEHEERMFYSNGFTVGVQVPFPKMCNVGASE